MDIQTDNESLSTAIGFGHPLAHRRRILSWVTRLSTNYPWTSRYDIACMVNPRLTRCLDIRMIPLFVCTAPLRRCLFRIWTQSRFSLEMDMILLFGHCMRYGPKKFHWKPSVCVMVRLVWKRRFLGLTTGFGHWRNARPAVDRMDGPLAYALVARPVESLPTTLRV